MRNSIKINALRVLAVACVACLSLTLLSGCAATEPKKDDAQLNREYMSSVNRISAEAAEDLAGFGEAAAEGDLAAMRLAAADASKTLEKIADLNVPKPLADVHSEYTEGAADLDEALTKYIDLYARVQNAGVSLSDETVEAEVAEVNALYESGIEHLSAADEMVAKLAGPTEEEAAQEEGSGAAKEAANDLSKLLSGE